MTQTVYTFGYAGQHRDRFIHAVKALDATVFDIRFSPRSRNAAWAGQSLAASLGGRYRHVRELGNRNYKGSDIQIVDLRAAYKIIEASERPVILLCVCGDVRQCHRAVIARALLSRGLSVQELDLTQIQPLQPSLWDLGTEP